MISFIPGKLPATPSPDDFKFATYLKASLPPHPKSFGSETLVNAWGVLGNDRAGDCVFAGAAHETMLWNAMTGKSVRFDDASVLADYSAVTGYNPADPASDQGTDMGVALSYRRKTGIVDATGARHTIGAYVALKPGNFPQLLNALWLFGAVGIGIRFPASAMVQFNWGKTWGVSKSPIEGGHYVPVVADRNGKPVCVTWGKLQPMTQAFYKTYCDESYAILSEEMLNAGKSIQGFDLAALRADLAAL